MEFSKFTFSKKYLRQDSQSELFFDFDLREVTGHNRKTFDSCQSIIYFLQNNAGKKIFLTLTQTEDFWEENEQLVINLKHYQEFCKQIGQNAKNRAQAYLAQRIKHYSDDQKREIIANSTEEEILLGFKT